MDNVSKLSERRSDLRKYQSALIEAENASMEALGKCCQAGAAFVGAFFDLEMSVVNPEVQEMLERIPEIMRQAAGVPKAISQAHIAAQSMIAASQYSGDVVLSGGLPKRPPIQNG